MLQQRRLPKDKKRNLPQPYKGRAAVHFVNQRWFFHPFTPPLAANYVFEYAGTDTVAGRPAHMVVGYGPKNERSWFYFDQQTFLVTRWGGIGPVARGEAYLDYQAKGFKAINVSSPPVYACSRKTKPMEKFCSKASRAMPTSPTAYSPTRRPDPDPARRAQEVAGPPCNYANRCSGTAGPPECTRARRLSHGSDQ